MADLDEFRDMFFVECDELLEVLATGLRQMETPTDDKETVHGVFRAVHSIKGGAAAFALTELVTFAHRFETVLDQLRSDRLKISAGVMAVMHRCSDCLADLVSAARKDRSSDQQQAAMLLDELDGLLVPEEANAGDFCFVPVAISFDDGVDDSPRLRELEITFKPHADLYRSGNEPAALIHALQKLGEAKISLDTSALSALQDWTLDEPQLSWHMSLRTDSESADVAAIFEFVEDCCVLAIQETPAAEGHILEQSPAEVAAVKAAPQPEVPPPAAVPTQAAATPAAAPDNAPAATIRVSLDRVDRLMNMIGEMVIKEAMLSQVIRTAGLEENPDVGAGLDAIRQLAGDIQESVMAIRAQPLKLVFQRMHRIARETSDATGKPVRMVTVGEQTEVDKTVIERLIDPLTHMIRNSIDHGLEDAVTRQRRGKPLDGLITLSAAHRSGRVQIEVADDGGGIDRARVRQIAEDKGLIAAGVPLSPSEIDQLLFLPGFSSKQEVSSLSGRGVGLDVVRKEIMALGGRVMISSVEGKGTTFSIALPLTLAVLEGMLIQLGDQTMVLPITAVQETLRPGAAMLHGVGQTGQLLANRGELIPVIDLGATFGLPADPALSDGGILIVVETDSQKRAAFRVDGIFDQRQVVIKSLEENYGRVAGVSAATILGDGKIALIIDPEEIVLSASSEHNRAATRAVNG